MPLRYYFNNFWPYQPCFFHNHIIFYSPVSNKLHEVILLRSIGNSFVISMPSKSFMEYFAHRWHQFFELRIWSFFSMLLALCPVWKSHVPTPVNWLSSSSLHFSVRTLRKNKFTLGPSEETWRSFSFSKGSRHCQMGACIICR